MREIARCEKGRKRFSEMKREQEEFVGDSSKMRN